MATITNGIITSFSNTPQANNDYYENVNLTEDATSVFYIDVMANDLGGKAKTLYSLDDGTENEVPLSGADLADLLTKDVMGADNYSANGALIEFVVKDGISQVAYSMTADSKAAFQHLGAGEVGYDTFTYAIRLSNGAIAKATVTVEIQGNNDAAEIGGSDSGSVTEDGPLQAAGDLSISDVDGSDEESFVAQSVTNAYGSFNFDADGVWTFDLDNDAVQGLGEGEAGEQQEFTVESVDGTEHTITVGIVGNNDAPDLKLVGTDSAAKTLAETNAGLSTSGTLTVNDVDQLDTVSSLVTAVVASGTTAGLVSTNPQLLAMMGVAPPSGLAANSGDANNLAWTFNSGSQAFDYLAVGQSLTLTYTVQSSDNNSASDTQTIAITITGSADGPAAAPAVFTGTGDPNDNDSATGTSTGGATGGNDTLVGTSGTNTISGGSGNDNIYGLGGDDSIYGGDNNDKLYGGAGNDYIEGNVNNDDIWGGSGNDTILGNDNNDGIYGGSGNDSINGGDNADDITGGYGADTLTGAAGSDDFNFLDLKDTGDWITDFASGDKIDFSAVDANTAVSGNQTFAFVSGATTTLSANSVIFFVHDNGTVGVPADDYTVVQADTDGNTATAEIQIQLTGIVALVAGDFVL